MIVDREMVVRGLARAAKLRADELSSTTLPGATLTSVLEDLIKGNFTTEISAGKVVVSSNFAGSNLTFAFPNGVGPLEIIGVFEEVLAWCQQFTDPDNPTFEVRRLNRLQADFSGAWINL